MDSFALAGLFDVGHLGRGFVCCDLGGRFGVMGLDAGVKWYVRYCVVML